MPGPGPPGGDVSDRPYPPPPPLPFQYFRPTAKNSLRCLRCQADLRFKMFGPPSAGDHRGTLGGGGGSPAKSPTSATSPTCGGSAPLRAALCSGDLRAASGPQVPSVPSPGGGGGADQCRPKAAPPGSLAGSHSLDPPCAPPPRRTPTHFPRPAHAVRDLRGSCARIKCGRGGGNGRGAKPPKAATLEVPCLVCAGGGGGQGADSEPKGAYGTTDEDFLVLTCALLSVTCTPHVSVRGGGGCSHWGAGGPR